MKRFEDNARVCFVGDSITHTGIFLKYIVSAYRMKFSDAKVEFYNCGIAGGGIGNAIKVFDEDIAIYDPTHIVLMIGINDSGRGLLNEPASMERYEKLFDNYTKYQNNLERFYSITRERNIKLILCTPMPYAEYIESEVPPLRGGCALIQGYATFVKEFAREKNLELCDYYSSAIESMQSKVLYQADRVHPNKCGHALMAKTFLAAQGIDYVANEDVADDVEAWYQLTQKIRNIITAEYLNVPNYIDKSSHERQDYILKLYEKIKNGTYKTDAYLTSLINSYVTDKQHQAEYIECVKQFMKTNKIVCENK